VVSVGAGWHPGRHLFPAPAWELLAVDAAPGRPEAAVAAGEADAGLVARAGELDALSDGGWDAVLYRFVLHHVAYAEPLGPILAEAARLLRPGGVLVAVEPGRRHPVGLGLTAANRLGLGVRAHGTPDDVPLAPGALVRAARAAGLAPELHAVTYGWRRLPPRAQRALTPLERWGSAPGARTLGHTLLLVARRPAV
jgi:SAM-dependent methyltransferase